MTTPRDLATLVAYPIATFIVAGVDLVGPGEVDTRPYTENCPISGHFTQTQLLRSLGVSSSPQSWADRRPVKGIEKITSVRLAEILTERDVVSSEVITDALYSQDKNGEPFVQVLVTGGHITELDLA